MHAHRLDTSPVYYVPHPIDDHLVVAVLVPGRDRVQLLREHVLDLDADAGNVPVILALAGLGFLRLVHVVSAADATQDGVSVRDLEPEEQAVVCLPHALWTARRRGCRPDPESHS